MPPKERRKKDREEEEDDETPLKFDETLNNVLVVDGFPIVPEEKLGKLESFIRKVFSKFPGTIVDNGLTLPTEASEGGTQTTGFGFIEYETPDMAKEVLPLANNYRFDKKHTLKVVTWAEYEKVIKIPDAYKAPEKKTDDLDSKNINLRSWLLDPFYRDQFVVRHGNETEVYWHDPFRKSDSKGKTDDTGEHMGRELVYAGERRKRDKKSWTKGYVAWSPLGSFLATFHPEGIVLWGGEDFQELPHRFPHPQVKWIDFSPQERYLVTCNGHDPVSEDDSECIIIWDIKTGLKKRGFDKGFSPAWPVFKWTQDEKYFARVDKDKILVFETPDMGLVDKKSIPIDRVHEIQWAPREKDYILAYWVPEAETDPATVALLEIPSKKKLRDVHVHTRSALCPRRAKEYAENDKCTMNRPCRDCKITLHWQNKGEYLAAKMCRRKTKKQVQTTFHILRLTEYVQNDTKEVPVEVLDLDEPVSAFSWEPSSKRFGIVHGEGKSTVAFYELKSNKLKLISQLTERPCNLLFWSPRGNMVILAGLNQFQGILEFYDVNNKETCALIEHFMCTELEWDPSGRYVMTAVTQPMQKKTDGFYRYNTENGYRMWTMHGNKIADVRLESCYQVMWRPRPPRLLSREAEQEIKKTLKNKYWDKFIKEDEELDSRTGDEVKHRRAMMESKWQSYRDEVLKAYKADASARAELRGGETSDPEAELTEVEEIYEEEISVQEEIME